jgi:hypothetical protein
MASSTTAIASVARQRTSKPQAVISRVQQIDRGVQITQPCSATHKHPPIEAIGAHPTDPTPPDEAHQGPSPDRSTDREGHGAGMAFAFAIAFLMRSRTAASRVRITAITASS